MAIEVTPSTATLGATVRGVSLAHLDEAAWTALLDAFHEHAVLVFPEQFLTRDEQLAFSKRFGPLELVGRSTPGSSPDIAQVSNRCADGTISTDPHSVSMRVLLGNMDWHADSSFRTPPAKASMLTCECAAPQDGETEFADMRAAYDALDEERRTFIEGRIVTHSYLYSHGKLGGLEADTFTAEQRATMGPADRPIIAQHEVTGRRTLCIGRHAHRLSGLADRDASRFLDELVEWACRAPRVLRHEWHAGDAVLWDNRSVLHRARPWNYDEARVMWHTRIAGSKG